MEPKPDGLIYINPKTQTVELRFNKTRQVFVTNKKAWKYFLTKHCSEITDIPVRDGRSHSQSGGRSHSQSGGSDPLEHGITERESIDRLFRPI